MKNYNLGFISDQNFYKHVKNTIEKYRIDKNIDLKRFNKNIVDPIKLTFDLKTYKKDIESVVEFEILRQLDKSNTNHIGYFHQNIFQYFHDDWSVPDLGYDVINEKKMYFVEMKNKHNTMNSSASQKTYMRMQNTLLSNPGSICFLVEVIAKHSQNIPWRVSLDGTSVVNENIRKVSIDNFYEMVTGDRYAFKKLCDKLPEVIDDVLEDLDVQSSLSGCVLDELKNISPDAVKSLYILSFKEYHGF